MATKRTVVEQNSCNFSLSFLLQIFKSSFQPPLLHTHKPKIYFKCFYQNFYGMEEFVGKFCVFFLYDVICTKEKFEKGKRKQQPNVSDNSRQKGEC